MRRTYILAIAIVLFAGFGVYALISKHGETEPAADLTYPVADLSQISTKALCPEASGQGDISEISVTPVSIPLNPNAAEDEDNDSYLFGLEYIAGFELTSDAPQFGGLSGIDFTADGKSMYLISDQGYMFRLPRAALEDMFAPFVVEGFPLLDSLGQPLKGKRQKDAEGLAIIGDITLVSFERNHRILAYAPQSCLENSRGQLVVDLPNHLPAGVLGGGRIRDNGGAEAVTMVGNTLAIGLEVTHSGQVGLIQLPIEKGQEPQAKIFNANLPIVGADTSKEGVIYTLHRDYDPQAGNTIQIFEHSGDKPTLLAELARPLNVDNFEGLSVQEKSDGEKLIYIISDNNFSENQRTLLYIFRKLSDK